MSKINSFPQYHTEQTSSILTLLRNNLQTLLSTYLIPTVFAIGAFEMSDPIYAAYVRDPGQRRLLRGKIELNTPLADYILGCKAHSHLRKINVIEDQLGISGNLIMFGHHPGDIADAIKRFVDFSGSGSNSWYGGLTPSQRLGINEYRRLRAGCPQCPELVKVLKQYYNAFNKIFFFGALRNLSTIRVVDEIDEEDSLGQCISAVDDGCEQIPRRSACLIELLYLQGEDPELISHPPERLIEYLETLLHEMVHAFFAIYSCPCSKCATVRTRLIGEGGHQSSWQIAAQAIELAAEQILEEPLDLGRTTSLAYDWYEHGETYPHLLDYTALNMTRREVVEKLKQFEANQIAGEQTEGKGSNFIGKCTPGMYASLDAGPEAGDLYLEEEDEDYEADTDSSSSEEDYDEMELICTENLFDEDIEEIEQMERIWNQSR